MKSVNYKLFLFFFVIILIFSILIILLPDIVTRYFDGIEINSEAFLKQRNDYRTSLIQIGGGIVVVLGLYFTFRRIKAHENQVLQLQKQIQVQEEGQITERFTRAIEHLGSDNIAIRLGGIYALERIAKDSFKDHWTVMEILTTFIKEKSPMLEYDIDENITSDPSYSKPISQDIQAIVNVLCRRSWIPNEKKNELKLDLSHCNLDLAKFFNADLEFCSFLDSSLRFTKWSNVNLNHTAFHNCNVSDANFYNVSIQGSSISEVDFSSCLFSIVNFTNSSLVKLDFINGKFHTIDMTSSYLSNCNFSKSMIYDMNLKNSILFDLDFSESHLHNFNFNYEEISGIKSFYNTYFKDSSLLEKIKKENIDKLKKII